MPYKTNQINTIEEKNKILKAEQDNRNNTIDSNATTEGKRMKCDVKHNSDTERKDRRRQCNEMWDFLIIGGRVAQRLNDWTTQGNA